MILPFDVKLEDGTTIRINAPASTDERVLGNKAKSLWAQTNNGRPPKVTSVEAIVATRATYMAVLGD